MVKRRVQILKRTIIYFGYIKKFKIAKYLKLAGYNKKYVSDSTKEKNHLDFGSKDG